MKTYGEVKRIESKSVGMMNSLDIDNSRHSSRKYRAGDGAGLELETINTRMLLMERSCDFCHKRGRV